MKILRLLVKFINSLSDWSGKIVSFLILISIFVIIWNVTARYGFKSYSAWSQQMTVAKVSLAYVAIGAAYTLRTRSHINVDLLYSRFSPRVRGIIDVITSTLFFLYCSGLMWKAIEATLKMRVSIRSFLPPYWPPSLLVIIGVSLLLLQGLAKFIRDLATAIKGESVL